MQILKSFRIRENDEDFHVNSFFKFPYIISRWRRRHWRSCGRGENTAAAAANAVAVRRLRSIVDSNRVGIRQYTPAHPRAHAHAVFYISAFDLISVFGEQRALCCSEL